MNRKQVFMSSKKIKFACLWEAELLMESLTCRVGQCENANHSMHSQLCKLLQNDVDSYRVIHHMTRRGERIVFWWPNTNANIIRFPKNDRRRIQILFVFPKMTETNITWLPRNDWIQILILFGSPIMTKYKYHSASQKWTNTIYKYTFCWAAQKEGL